MRVDGNLFPIEVIAAQHGQDFSESRPDLQPQFCCFIAVKGTHGSVFASVAPGMYGRAAAFECFQYSPEISFLVICHDNDGRPGGAGLFQKGAQHVTFMLSLQSGKHRLRSARRAIRLREQRHPDNRARARSPIHKSCSRCGAIRGKWQAGNQVRAR